MLLDCSFPSQPIGREQFICLYMLYLYPAFFHRAQGSIAGSPPPPDPSDPDNNPEGIRIGCYCNPTALQGPTAANSVFLMSHRIGFKQFHYYCQFPPLMGFFLEACKENQFTLGTGRTSFQLSHLNQQFKKNTSRSSMLLSCLTFLSITLSHPSPPTTIIFTSFHTLPFNACLNFLRNALQSVI